MTDSGEIDLERYRAMVTDALASVDALMETTAEDQAPVKLDQQSSGRLTRMDAMQRQAMAAETQRRRKLRRLQLEQALKRIDDGEFGYCASCGDEIPAGRCDVEPVFHLCVKCAKSGLFSKEASHQVRKFYDDRFQYALFAIHPAYCRFERPSSLR